jgi:hypothetical protein
MSPRTNIINGQHTAEVLRVLSREIQDLNGLATIVERGRQIIEKAVDPSTGNRSQHSTDGLLYGLIQSGKTSIITVTVALAADNGFQCIIILTSDIDLLYDQTLERVKRALRGLSVLGKQDWRDPVRFNSHLRTPPFVIVCSKNSSKLNSLLEVFRNARAGSLSALIIDDEADQASLNTFTNKQTGQISRINNAISELRGFFRVNTYLQVTATPQALFLQRPSHNYRPAFTVLSSPGQGYVGGEVFFGPAGELLRPVDIHEVESMRATHQPAPTGNIPPGLRQALLVFFVGATIKTMQNSPAGEQGYAFLCHVSVNKRDHEHIVSLIDRFKEDLINILRNSPSAQYDRLVIELQAAYDDLAQTQGGMPPFQEVIGWMKFYIHGVNIKLINATSNEEIQLDSVYNVFVGGNKLGRGVTIKNLLVSYYGRNPRRPNADTVLQHARMYGYRQHNLGVTRLFLPDNLAEHFRLIHQMENALRDLVNNHPEGNFEGIFISDPLRATRNNVLDPNSIGIYVAGASYNPAYPLRTAVMQKNTEWLDSQLSSFNDQDRGREVTIDFIVELIEKCQANPEVGIELWNHKTLKAALEKIKTLYGNKAYLVVRRDRNLNVQRRETQGILDGGEHELAPRDAPTLFMYRQNSNPRGEIAVWWPQLRFSEGNYVLAFSFDW